MKLIDADALLTNFDELEPYKDYESEHDMWLDMRLEVIHAPTIEQPQWISCAERLPDAWIPVLIYVPSEHPFPTVGEGYIDEIGRFHAHRMMAIFGDGEVTHWMPLPQPPKGDE